MRRRDLLTGIALLGSRAAFSNGRDVEKPVTPPVADYWESIRRQFALDRRWPPVIAAVIPLMVNTFISMRLGAARPEYIGLGSSVGLFAGFAALFVMAHLVRKQWLAQG